MAEDIARNGRFDGWLGLHFVLFFRVVAPGRPVKSGKVLLGKSQLADVFRSLAVGGADSCGAHDAAPISSRRLASARAFTAESLRAFSCRLLPSHFAECARIVCVCSHCQSCPIRSTSSDSLSETVKTFS